MQGATLNGATEQKKLSFLQFFLKSTLWDDGYSNAMQYIFFIIANVQSIAILLWVQFYKILPEEKNSFLTVISEVSRIISVKEIFYFELEGIRGVIPIMIVLCYFLIIFATFGMLIRSFCFEKQISKLQNFLLIFIGQLHLCIGFWVVNIILMEQIKNRLMNDESISSLNSQQISCTVGEILLVTFNYLIGLFFAFLSYDPFISSNAFAAHTPVFQILTFFMNSILSPIITFVTANSLTWIFSCSSFLTIGFRHYQLITRFPFYQFSPMLIASIASGISLMISLFSIGILIFNRFLTIQISTVVFSEFFLAVLVSIYIRNYMLSVISNYADLESKDLKSKHQVLRKLFSISHTMQQGRLTLNNKTNKDYSEIGFWGIINNYLKKKGIKDVYVYKNSQNLEKIEIDHVSIINKMCEHYTDIIDKVKKNILLDSIGKLKHEKKLRLILAHLALNMKQAESASILFIEDFNQFDGLSKPISLKLYEKAQHDIDRFFQQSKGKILDLKTYIEQERISDKLLKLIHSNTKLYSNFWSTFCESYLKVKDLFDKSREFEKEADAITNLWRKSISENKVLRGSLSTIYSLYLSIVRNTPYLAHKISRMYDMTGVNRVLGYGDDEMPLSQESLNDHDLICFYVSMAKEKIGKIGYVSSNITELLGWNRDDLIEKDIEVVMPPFMREKHGKMLIRYLKNFSEASTSSRMYQTIQAFILDKAANILACDVYISIHPYVQDTPVFLGLVRIKKNQSDKILLSPDGQIEGLSKSITENLGLNSGFKHNINIKDICQNYQDLERVIEEMLAYDSLHQEPQAKSLKQKKSIPLRRKNFDRSSQIELEENQPLLEVELRFNSSHNRPKKRTEANEVYFVKPFLKYFDGWIYFVLNLQRSTTKELNRMINGVIHEEKSEDEENIVSLAEVPSKSFVNILPSFLTSQKPLNLPNKPNKRFTVQTNSQYSKNYFESGTMSPSHTAGDIRSPTLINETEYLKSQESLLHEHEFFENSAKNFQNRIQSRPGTKVNKSITTNLFSVPLIKTLNANTNHIDSIASPSQKSQDNKVEQLFSPSRDFILSPQGSNKPLFPNSSGDKNAIFHQENRKKTAINFAALNNLASSSMDSSVQAYMIKLEQAVNIVPRNYNLTRLNIFGILFIVIAGCVLTIVKFQNGNTLDEVSITSEASSKAVFRLVRIIDLAQYARNLWQLNLGLLSNDRYKPLGWTQDANDLISHLTTEIISDLNNWNNQLRGFVDNLKDELQIVIYNEKINVFEMNPKGEIIASRSSNVFSLITQLVSEATELIKSGIEINSQNSYLQFCLKNAFNDLLIASEKVIPILEQDGQLKLQDQTDLLTISMVSIGCIGISVLIFFYYVNKWFISDRNHFLSIFLRLDKNKVHQQIHLVEKFATLLETSGFSNKTISSKIQEEKLVSYSTKKKLKDQKSMKLSDTRGLNTRLFIIYLSAVVSSLVIFSSYPVLLVIANFYNQNVTNKLSLKTQSNMNLYNYNILLTTLYEYIQENATTIVRNRPIKEEWETTFYKMTRVQDFILLNLLNEENGLGSTPQLYDMAMGSLCDNIVTTDQNLQKMCKTMGGGAVQRGIIGFNSYTLATLKAVKDSFDNSNKTFEDMISAFSKPDLINLEVFYPFTYNAYIWIDNLIESELLTDFKALKDDVLIFLVIYLVFYAFSIGIIWRKIISGLKNEMTDSRKLMRRIPLPMIKENKMLKRYLVTHSGGAIGSLQV